MHTLSPAYGADYKSKAEVLEAWLGHKDFILETANVPYSGKPMNMMQATQNAYNIRYHKLRKVCLIKRVGDSWIL